jgi:glycopeptide antibiotics resistance protein
MRPRLLLDIDEAACLTAVLVLALTPYPGPNELQLVPFAHRRELLLDTVGNVLLFLPFGAALCLRGCTIGRTVLSGVALSVGLEITQLVVPGRTTSRYDVPAQHAGSAAG